LRPSKGTSLGESASYTSRKSVHPFLLQSTTRKKGKGREGKERYTKSQVGYISPTWGTDPLLPISKKIGKVVGVHDVINHSKFGFNIFRGIGSTGGQIFRFPIDFAGHRYNSAAATAQPVMSGCLTFKLLSGTPDNQLL